MSLPEHLMPLSWQERHRRATVAAGATQFQAQAPYLLAVGPVREIAADAHADSEAMDRLFFGCPENQRGAAAQAMMNGGSDDRHQ